MHRNWAVRCDHGERPTGTPPIWHAEDSGGSPTVVEPDQSRSRIGWRARFSCLFTDQQRGRAPYRCARSRESRSSPCGLPLPRKRFSTVTGRRCDEPSRFQLSMERPSFCPGRTGRDAVRAGALLDHASRLADPKDGGTLGKQLLDLQILQFGRRPAVATNEEEAIVQALRMCAGDVSMPAFDLQEETRDIRNAIARYAPLAPQGCCMMIG